MQENRMNKQGLFYDHNGISDHDCNVCGLFNHCINLPQLSLLQLAAWRTNLDGFFQLDILQFV